MNSFVVGLFAILAAISVASASVHGLHGVVAVGAHPHAWSPVGPSGVVTGYGASGPSGTVTGAGAVGPSGIVTGHGPIGPTGPAGQGHGHGIIAAAPIVAAAPVYAAPLALGVAGHGAWGVAGHGSWAHGGHGAWDGHHGW